MTGGYDEGYRQCPCFWGIGPGRFVRKLFERLETCEGMRALDVGCGEGKNAAFMTEQGVQVDAIDISHLAIAHAVRQWPDIDVNWRVEDVRSLEIAPETYDIVIAYGLLHCLDAPESIRQTVARLQAATAPHGFNVLCSFNDGPQDLSAHEGFSPCLVPHAEYLRLYKEWAVIEASDEIRVEEHPNNHVLHSHSLTRILARKGGR
jgi:tellurite methyltransferase